MVARPRSLVALLLTCSLALTHTSSLLATGRANRPATDGSSSAARGTFTRPQAVSIDFEIARGRILAQRAAFERLLQRPAFAGAKGSNLRRQAARLNKILLYIDIGRATGQERHELIRRLPVTIAETKAAGNIAGTYRSYTAGGKVRVRVFVPRSVPALPGLGREFDQPDGGAPSKGSRAPEECFYEDEDGAFSGPCVTQQEVDDAASFAADLESGESQMEADADAAYSDIYEYCQMNPCEDLLPASGPSAVDDASGPLQCLGQGASAVGAAASAVVARVKLFNLVRSGGILAVSAGALFWKVTLAAAAVAGAVIFIGATIECYRELYPMSPALRRTESPVLYVPR